MALYATNRFLGDGSTTSYEFNFVGKYIDRTHVKVYQEDNATKVRTYVSINDSNFLNDTTLRSLPVTPVGSTLVIYRDTPKPPLVDFVNGSRFTEYNMDLVARQGLFVAMEALDEGGNGVITLPSVLDATQVNATLPSTPGVTTVQQALDFLWNEIDSGWQAKVDTEANIGAAASSSLLSPNHFYRSSDTGKLWFALSTSALLLTAPEGGGGGGGGGYTPPPKVVVIGDSMAAQHPLQSESWPAVWETRMRMVGAPVRVVDLAVGGWTYNKANTLVTHGTNTMIQQAIAEAPAMVIVNLGANDQALRVEGRSLAQAQADCNTALNALRAGLPSAVIVVVSEYLFDSVNFPTPGTTLKNKGTIPGLMQKKTGGILSGFYTGEMLDDSASSTQKTNFADWISLDTYARGHSAVNGSITMRAWRAVRMGAVGLDGIHLNALGQHILAGYALVAAQTVPAMKALWPQISADQVPEWRDPDALFSAFFTASGDGYTQRSALSAVWANQLSKHWGGVPLARGDNWWAPSGGTVGVWPQGVTTDETLSPVMYWKMAGCLPLEACSASIDGGAFSTTYGAVTTDARGDSMGLIHAHWMPAGTRTLRYKVGNEVFGPFTISIGTKPVTPAPPATAISASLVAVPGGTVSQTQQALDFLWNEIGTGYQARVDTESAILAMQSGGTLYPNHLYRSSDTNKVWLALSTNALRLLAPEPAPAAAAVPASLALVPAVTQTQQALDFLWTEIGTGYQAKVDTEANISALAGSSSLYPNHLYRSSDTNKVWLALAVNSLLLLAPETAYTPPTVIAARITKTSAVQAITPATWTTVALNNVAENAGGGTFSSNQYTIPVGGAGRYLLAFTTCVQRGTPNNNVFQYMNAAVDVNGTQRAAGSGGYGATLSATFAASSGSVVTYLNVGDTIRMSMICSEPVNVIAGSSNASTYLSLIRLSTT